MHPRSRIQSLLKRKDVDCLADGIYRIQGRNSGKFPHCNAFLLTDSETVLIDTGIGKDKLARIDEQIRIDRVIISHPHPDHISGFEWLSDRHLMMPGETRDEITDLKQLGKRFTGSAESGRQWAAFARKTLGLVPLRQPDTRFSDGDIIVDGRHRLEAIHTPGHLNDHYGFFEHHSGTLLSTDIDFSSFGPWYGNPESAIRPFRASIEKLMHLPYARVCSSHKSPIEGDATDAFNQYLDGFDRHRRIVFEICDPPKTLEEMTDASPFYHNRLPDRTIQYIFEQSMIRKNLEMLLTDGLVGIQNGRYYRIH